MNNGGNQLQLEIAQGLRSICGDSLKMQMASKKPQQSTPVKVTRGICTVCGFIFHIQQSRGKVS